MKVQLCKTNLLKAGGAGARALLDACKAAGAEVERKECLLHCAHCQNAAIALVDGVLVGAPTAQELAQQIREAT